MVGSNRVVEAKEIPTRQTIQATRSRCLLSHYQKYSCDKKSIGKDELYSGCQVSLFIFGLQAFWISELRD